LMDVIRCLSPYKASVDATIHVILENEDLVDKIR
jgi:hypothetical protein